MIKADFVGPVTALAFLNNWILLAGTGSSFKVYNVLSGVLLITRSVFQRDRIHGIRVVNRNNLDMGLACTVLVYGGRSMSILQLKIDEKSAVVIEAVHEFPDFSDWIHDVIFLPEVSTLLLAFGRHTIQQWFLVLAEPEQSPQFNFVAEFRSEEKCLIYSARFWPKIDDQNNMRIATGTIFNEVLIWDIPLQQSRAVVELKNIPVHSRFIGHEGVIFKIQLSHDLSLISSVSDDRTIRLWDLKMPPGTPAQVLYGHAGRVWDCQFMNSGRMASIAEDCQCILWEFQKEAGSWQVVDSLKGHHGKSVWSLAISPDRRIVCTGGADAGIRLWPSNRETDLCKQSLIRSPSRKMRNFAMLSHDWVHAEYPDGEASMIYDAPANEWETFSNSKYDDIESTLFHFLAQTDDKRFVFRVDALAMSLTCFEVARQSRLKRTMRTLDLSFNQKVTNFIVCQASNHRYHIFIMTYDHAWQCRWLVYLFDKNQFQKMATLNTCPSTGLKSQNMLSAVVVEDEASGDHLAILGSRESTLFVYHKPKTDLIGTFEDELLDPVAVQEQVHNRDAITCAVLNRKRELLTAGRDGQLIQHSLSFDAPYVTKLSARRTTKGSVEKILLAHDKVITVNFFDKIMTVRDEAMDQDIFSVDCGGSKRLWEVCLHRAPLDDAWIVMFGFLRQGQLHLFRHFVSYPSSLVGFQSSKLTGTGSTAGNGPYYHGRETRCVQWAPLISGSSKRLFFTGGEDSHLLLFHLQNEKDGKSHLVNLDSVRHRYSAVNDIDVAPIDDGLLLFSCGGREELMCWKIQQVQNEMVQVSEWSVCPSMSQVPDVRIMAVHVRPLRRSDQPSGQFVVAAVTSDSFLHILIFDQISQRFTFLGRRTNTRGCYLKARWVPSSADRYLVLTTSTDGVVSIWDVSGDVMEYLLTRNTLKETLVNVCRDGRKSVKMQERCLLELQRTKLVCAQQLHQSGIHDVFIFCLPSSSTAVIVTVGDDERISLSTLDSNLQVQWKAVVDGAHHSAITGVCAYAKDDKTVLVFTVSLDQSLKRWLWKTNTNELKFISSTHLDIADASAIDLHAEQNSLDILVTGVGLQHLKTSTLEIEE